MKVSAIQMAMCPLDTAHSLARAEALIHCAATKGTGGCHL